MSLSLLRLLPLLSQTVSLTYAMDEMIFLGTWLHPDLRSHTNANLPAWFATWLNRGKWVIILSYPLTWTTSALNLFSNRSALHDSGAATWYWGGLVLSAAHMLYGMKAMGLLADISNDRPKGNVVFSMGVWMNMHVQRTLLTDVPSWLCFIAAFLTAHKAV